MCGARTARPAASVLSGVGKAPSPPWRLPQSAGRHRQLTAASRQSPVASRQSPVASRQSPAKSPPSFPRRRESRDFAPALRRPGSPARTSMDSRFRGNDGLGGSAERRRCRPLRASTAAIVVGAGMAAMRLYWQSLIAAMAAPTKRTDWPPQRHRRRRFIPPRRSAGGPRCRGRGRSRCAAASPGARTGARSGPGRCRRRRGRRRGPCGCRPR